MKNLFLLIFSAFIILSCEKSKETVASTETDQKVEALLSKMTLEEKIGQMAQINITMLMSDSIFQHYDSVTVFQLDSTKLFNLIKNYHIGSFLNGRGVSKDTWFPFMDQLQRLNMKYSRLKIPLLYGVDHVHGSSYLKEGTIFPHNINIAATFDTTHSYEMGKVTIYETSGLGHNWIFGPVMDLGRNKFWGRYYETYGEDPVVTAQMGKAFINGIQGADNNTAPYKVAACAKHFLGYSDPKSGWDRSPAEIPDQILREFFLPPFKEAIDAGVKTIMVNSGELNGIPVHASPEILTKLLREELGFKGVVITDWMDIIALEKMHYVCENEKEATLKAIQAGIDISMIPLTTDFNRYVKELVEEGRLTEERIDQSVRRILALKFDLGLFENPYPDKNRLEKIGRKESKEKALNAARESIVLLKNNSNFLPLKARKIVVTGTTSNRKVPLCGGWTYRFAAKSDWWFPDSMPTILDAIKEEFDAAEVIYATPDNIKTASRNADVILFAAGESEAYAETDGSINTLDLSPDQLKLAEKVYNTGIPVVLILTEGRPRMVAEMYDQSHAVLFAGLPGIEGATAIAEVLSGKVNPSGKMPFTYPLRQGHIIPYNYKRSEYSVLRPVKGELTRFALAEFGQGLSYTKFSYSDLRLSDSITDGTQKITAKVKVTNTGNIIGKEAVLWFISDDFGSITRPIKELQHFEKQEFKPGETKEFTFEIIPTIHLSYPDKDGNQILEEGGFQLTVGNLKSDFAYRKPN